MLTVLKGVNNMNNLEEMPPRCHDCPYWEICEPPYVCPVDPTEIKND